MAIVAPITPSRPFQDAFAAYNAALPLRNHACSDEQSERAEEVIAPLFKAIVAHRDCHLSAIVSKCAAIVTEYQSGDCPIGLVESILNDLMALEIAGSNAQ